MIKNILNNINLYQIKQLNNLKVITILEILVKILINKYIQIQLKIMKLLKVKIINLIMEVKNN